LDLSSRRQRYATSAAASDRLPVPELTRSLVESRKSGSLTTVQLFAGHKKEGGSLPLYGSLMPYILDIEAVPIVGLRPDEKHVKNLEQVDLASLVVQPAPLLSCACKGHASFATDFGGPKGLPTHSCEHKPIQLRFASREPCWAAKVLRRA